jgi:hypothetical protein
MQVIRKSLGHKPYAVVRVYADNFEDVAVIEYFYAPDPAFDLADELNKKKIVGQKYEVMKYE